jgi:hypothetical protein
VAVLVHDQVEVRRETGHRLVQFGPDPAGHQQDDQPPVATLVNRGQDVRSDLPVRGQGAVEVRRDRLNEPGHVIALLTCHR